MTKKTILLTGGTGFLGGNLLGKLIERGFEVILLKRSFSNPFRINPFLDRVEAYNLDRIELPEVFARHRIHTVIHCATNYGRRAIAPKEIVEANLVLPLHLMQLAEAHGVHNFINTDTVLDKRVNHYSLSKSQFLDWLKLASAKMVCVNVALSHFYGPLDDESKLITKLTRDMLSGVGHIDLTPGLQRRDLIFIDDVVEAFLAVLAFADRQTKPYGFHPFEVGTGQGTSIRSLVEQIQTLAGAQATRLNFGALPYRENEVMDFTCDSSRLHELGWRARTSLGEGLRKTIASEREYLKQ